MELCNCCNEEPLKYKMTNTKDVKCCHCKYIKYTQGAIKLNLCKFECDNLYWWIVDNKTKKNDKNVNVSYCLEKDECDKCGYSDFQSVNFTGTMIGNTE